MCGLKIQGSLKWKVVFKSQVCQGEVWPYQHRFTSIKKFKFVNPRSLTCNLYVSFVFNFRWKHL